MSQLFSSGGPSIRASASASFLEFPCFLYDTANVGSSAFSNPSLYIWKFSIQVLLQLTLKDFEHNLISMENEWNCLVVRTFFSAALLWDWNGKWPFRCVVVLNMSSVKLLFQLKQAASREPAGNTHPCCNGSLCAFCCKDSPVSLCPAGFDCLLDFSQQESDNNILGPTNSREPTSSSQSFPWSLFTWCVRLLGLS